MSFNFKKIKTSRKNINRKEPFSQRPANFPDSKLDSFSQNFDSLLMLFDQKADNLIAMTGSTGSYQIERKLIAKTILEQINKGDLKGIQLINEMDEDLLLFSKDIEYTTKKLQWLQNELNKMDPDNVKNDADRIYKNREKNIY
tara:strand:+ start:5126 stop:5554 length:429 start_codon:yes stop_codon:yes gene_type:complete